MNQREIIKIKSTIFDRERELVIDKAFLSFDDRDRIGIPPTSFLKEEIVAFRRGVKWIRGYSFVIGRIYCLDILSISGAVIKVRMKSIYGVNRSSLSKKYNGMMDMLDEYFFNDLVRKFVLQFEDGVEFELLGIVIKSDSLQFDKSIEIAWHDVGIKVYNAYFAVFSKSTPENYEALEYLNDWNSEVLYSTLRSIVRHKGLLN